MDGWVIGRVPERKKEKKQVALSSLFFFFLSTSFFMTFTLTHSLGWGGRSSVFGWWGKNNKTTKTADGRTTVNTVVAVFCFRPRGLLLLLLLLSMPRSLSLFLLLLLLLI